MAQASFDTTVCRAISGLYSGVPIEVPAHMVQRVCGTGIEVLIQAADVLSPHKQIGLTLCVGAESMSRNPVASYTMRGGFRMGSVDFKDFLWEALRDPAANVSMGDTAENLARTYQITRPEVDAYAARSFARAVAAQRSGFLAGEIAPVKSETFEREGLAPRALKLKGMDELAADTHVRPSPVETLAAIRPSFGGRADRRQFIGHRRRRGGGARRLLRIRQEPRQGRARAHPLPAPAWACRRISLASAGAGDQGGHRTRGAQA